MYDLCTKELQDKLTPMRDMFKDKEERETERKLQLKMSTDDKSDADKKETEKETLPFAFEGGRYI